jgi:hypothetical protein
VRRSQADRRQSALVTFPLAVNGVLITEDRRLLSDRRLAA